MEDREVVSEVAIAAVEKAPTEAIEEVDAAATADVVNRRSLRPARAAQCQCQFGRLMSQATPMLRTQYRESISEYQARVSLHHGTTDCDRPNSVLPPDAEVQKIEDNLAIAVAKLPRDLSIEFPPRPGYGGDGKKIVLRVNYFNLSLLAKDMVLYRYDVATSDSDKRPKLDEDDDNNKVAKGKRRRLMDMLLEDPKFGNSIRASDGSATIVTNRALQLEQSEWVGSIALPRPGEDPFPPEQVSDSAELKAARKRNTVRFRLVLAGKVNVGELMKYLTSQRPGGHYAGTESLIQLLNILICRIPSADPFMCDVGRNQYFPLPGNLLNLREHQELGGGLEAVRGYFSSVRPATGRLLVNLNVKSAAFYKHGKLLDLVKEFLRGKDASDASSAELKELEAFLFHLRVETTYRKPRDSEGRPVQGKLKTKIHLIQGFARDPRFGNSRNVKFSFTLGRGGAKQTKTVEDYFREQNEITLREWKQPVLMLGTVDDPSYLPMELCSVRPGQPVRRLLSGPQTTEMLRFAARRPNANAESIEGIGDAPGFARLTFGLDSNAQPNTTRPLGFAVSSDMITVNARILNSPSLLYTKPGSKAQFVETPRFGSWNLANKAFQSPGTFKKFGMLVINYSGDRGMALRGSADELRKTFEGTLRGYGIRFMDTLNTKSIEIPRPTKDNRISINETLESTFRGAQKFAADVLLIILKENDNWVYSRIKFYCDIKAGIHTICSVGSKIENPKGQEMYMGNVALKFNIKGNGVAHIIKSSDLAQTSHFDDSTMLMGIDVTHPSPGSVEGAPSIAAVVASKDKYLCHYPGSVGLQKGRVEMVGDLANMVTERLQCWQRFNGNKLPTKIIIYRDGVSEGQFDQVLQHELVAVRSACTAVYAGKPSPKLTLIVCNKRHNTRAFPTKKDDADERNGFNCKPGTVFDRGITQPKYWEFFLQAHPSLQGSAKSARYIVLLDNIGFGKDEIQNFTHNLCYLFNRATKAVSVCPPAYYADLLCERGRAYLHSTMMENSDNRNATFNKKDAEWTGGVHANLRDSTWYI